MSRAVITGWGAMTPLGGARQTTAALCAGQEAFTDLDDAALRAMERGCDPTALKARRAARIDFNPRQAFAGKNFRPVDRTGQLTILAAQQALEDVGWSEEESRPEEIGLVLGTMFGSVHTISAFDRRGQEAGPKYVKPLDFANSVINAAAGQTAIWLGLRGTNSTVTGANAAGVLALAQASQLIRDGRSQVLLAGGVEELSFEALFSFQQADLLASESARPFEASRDGAVLGEGSALFLMESEGHARERGVKARAFLTGYGNAFDPSRGRDLKRASKTLESAVRTALDDAGLGVEEIDAVVCGACGWRGDEAEGLALGRVFEDRAPITTVTPWLGQCLGAGGAMQTLAMLHALELGELPGLGDPGELAPALPTLDLCRETRSMTVRRGLVTALGLDGGAAAIVLEGASDGSEKAS